MSLTLKENSKTSPLRTYSSLKQSSQNYHTEGKIHETEIYLKSFANFTPEEVSF